MDPNDIKYNKYVHASLPKDLLARIKAVTDVFENIDGVSYEEAVDLYKRDLDTDSNLIIWEEMVRVYLKFCNQRCKTHEERMEVYKSLLLRSLWPVNEAILRLDPQILTLQEAKELMSEYKLEAKPLDVAQE